MHEKNKLNAKYELNVNKSKNLIYIEDLTPVRARQIFFALIENFLLNAAYEYAAKTGRFLKDRCSGRFPLPNRVRLHSLRQVFAGSASAAAMAVALNSVILMQPSVTYALEILFIQLSPHIRVTGCIYHPQLTEVTVSNDFHSHRQVYAQCTFWLQRNMFSSRPFGRIQ